MADYYEYIGLTKDATSKEIKDRCNARLLEYAPDKNRDMSFEEANEATRILIVIRQTLLDDEKRRAYDLTLSSVTSEISVPPTRVIRYCKEKDGERCAEEEGIALPECSGCPNCTDPKVLKLRKQRKAQQEREAIEKRRQERMNTQSTNKPVDSVYKENLYTSSKNDSGQKNESIVKRILKKIFK